jgi:hypothetical protein
MSDQQRGKRRVRRVLPPEDGASSPQPRADQGMVRVPIRADRSAPIRRAEVTQTVAPPRSDLYQYIIGAVVSATVLGLILLIWVVATSGKGVANPAPGANTVSGDVPTIQAPLSSGTLVPGEVPTSNLVVPPAQPSRGPSGKSWNLLLDAR